MKSILLNYKTPFLFILLTVVVGYLQYNILAPHLKYGFADVDWTFLYRFKNLPPFSLNQIIGEWRGMGVYAYQTYYIGVQEIFFGLDYEKFHITTNLLRFLSTITLFPVVYYLTRDRLLSFLVTIIYSVSYPTVGAMYTVVTSGIYLALVVMNAFLLLYIYMIRNSKDHWIWITALFILFFLTLFLSAERMYPLIPLIFLIEFFLCWIGQFKKELIGKSLKRLLIIFIPLLISLLYRPYAQTNTQFLGNAKLLAEKVLDGNWHLLLTPFSSLGSLFIPRDYWRYFGVVNDEQFLKYLEFYLTSAGITFILITIFFAIFISQRPLRFTLRTLIPTFIIGLLSFFIIKQRLLVPQDLRMHYDPQIFLAPTLVGQFIFFLCYSFFEEWQMSKYRNLLYFMLFFGPFISFLFILATWIPAEPGLIFTGVHRYLTIPAVGSSLFLSAVIVLIFRKFQNLRYLKYFSFTALLILTALTIITNVPVIKNYFDYELEFAGTNGYEHHRMKNKLQSNLTNFSMEEPSLFYFDESQGRENGYFHETTLLAGFHFWMMFWNGKVLDSKLMPELMRSSLLCSGENIDCLEKVREYVTKKDGSLGIEFGNRFYKSENIYAFRLENRDIFDIREEFFKKMDLRQ